MDSLLYSHYQNWAFVPVLAQLPIVLFPVEVDKWVLFAMLLAKY
jgi:hypothetical protein